MVDVCQKIAACLYQEKWVKFFHCFRGRNLFPCKATVQQIAQFYLCLRKKLRLTVPLIEGYRFGPGFTKCYNFHVQTRDLRYAVEKILVGTFEKCRRSP